MAGTSYVVHFPAHQYLGLIGLGPLEYEPVIAASFRKYIGSGDTVVDIGANIGMHTVLASSLVGPSGTVIACEPDPQSLVLLSKCVITNRLSNVKVYGLAIGDHAGSVDLHVDLRTARTTSLLPSAWSPDKQSRFPLRCGQSTLDRVTEALKAVSLVKVDVEGAELAVLKGGQESIRRWRPVVLIECLEVNLPALEVYFNNINYKVLDVVTKRAVVKQTYSGNVLALPD